ncbi:amino-acid permease inda1 [Leucosporidium creatinivorum]|uniref:Amino-acid permease inda1 n=1 Tax=Leucosporidium creatinivorum TaxID=106004 RepID=A0A1Y2F5R9_9BASI|nr:amino-acid permease inda1 [Leucosporidium creatinivorum]
MDDNQKAQHAANDVEKAHTEGGIRVATQAAKPTEVLYDPSQETLATRWGLSLESFKRAPGSTGGIKVVGEQADTLDPLTAGANPLLQQQLQPRHVKLIAVGGSIGTGLFIGTGQALRNGGPGGILIAWLIVGVMLINVTQALGEMCIMYPVSGGFYTLSVRFIDPGFGVAMGINYLLQWLVTLPLELTAAALTMSYWTDAVSPAVWITVFWAIVIVINIVGTKAFAEEEMWSAIIKLIVITVFIIFGVVMNCGGGPSTGIYDHYIGGEFWRNPGAFANGFKGVCTVFVTAAFSFAGTELVGLAATETPNPRKTLPSAVKGTFWRLSLFFISSLLVIGLCVPYDTPRLADDSGTARASPFVILVDLAGVKGLPDLMNATICISILSIALASVYAGSRVLTALAETGFAPRCFAMVDKAGRPLWSVVFNLAWGAIAYVSLASGGAIAFDWMLAISGLSTLFTFLGICLSHIRFRQAWAAAGHSVEELPFRALGGIYGSILGSTIIVLILIAQFWVAISPIGLDPSTPISDRVVSFFQVMLALPVLLLVWAGVYLWKGFAWPLPVSQIDLDTGRKSWLTVQEMRAYRAERRAAPWHVRVYRMLFTN